MKKLFDHIKQINKSIWIIIFILIAIRLLLPYALKYTINWYLENKIVAYTGHIDDFDLALWRGAYQIGDLRIWKRGADKHFPLLEVKHLDLSLAWRALWHRRILGDLKLDGMQLQFVDSSSEKKKQFGGEEKNWNSVLSALVPIDLESLTVNDSAIHFINRDYKTLIDVYMDQLTVNAKNLRNTDDRKELLPSSATISARVQSQAAFHMQSKFNILRNPPAFEVQTKLTDLHLASLNPFFMAYGPFNVDHGNFSLFSEVATKEGKVRGYVKPFFEKVKVIPPHEHYVSIEHRLNEYLIGTANFILRNSEKNTATKIEFEGDLNKPEVHKWLALWISIKNAFGHPLSETIDRTIHIKDVPRKD